MVKSIVFDIPAGATVQVTVPPGMIATAPVDAVLHLRDKASQLKAKVAPPCPGSTIWQVDNRSDVLGFQFKLAAHDLVSKYCTKMF